MSPQTKDSLPSNKVGITLIIVVLIVAGTIFFEKFDFQKAELVSTKKAELILQRKTDEHLKADDEDGDNLPLWLEEFYGTDPQNPDTDGDGTPDGEEIELKRDPTVAGPDDPLLTYRDMLQTEVNLTDFTPGTLTESVSIDLFEQYLTLKRDGALTPEDEQTLLDQISQSALASSSLQTMYTRSDLAIVPSTKESVSAYGERYAQIATDIFLLMDSYKNTRDSIQYLGQIADAYNNYTAQVLVMSVPDVFDEVHLELVNLLRQTNIFFETIAGAGDDPVRALIVTAQYQALGSSERELYTILANYFKNNDIIFDIESTKNFWVQFEN